MRARRNGAPAARRQAHLVGPLARARTLPVAFVAISLLVPLVGLVAVREQYGASLRAAQIEAQHVAEPIAHTVAQSSGFDTDDPHDLYEQPDRLQGYISDIQHELGRDMEVMRTDRGTIVGAVVMEYTPIYHELLRSSAGTRRVIVATSIAGLVVALLVALLLARGLVGDLRRLAAAAGRLAAGHDHVRARVRTSGELGRLAEAFNDMAIRIAAQKAALTEVAISDPLTGLHNRRAFQARLAEEVERARRSGEPFALLMVDLDRFKAINDRHGHPVGDAALVAVAETFQRQVRAIDLPARLGGEEFAVLLPGSDERAARAAAERLRSEIAAAQIVHQGIVLRVTVSVGVACYPEDAQSGELLLRAADRALYQAKRAGRDRVCSYADLPRERVGVADAT